MKIIRSLQTSKKFTKDSVLIIGNLDGVHIGHQTIIKSAKKIAVKNNTYLGVLIFHPHPKAYFTKKNNFLITQLDQRIEILKKQNVDYVIVMKFDKKISSMTPKNFCDKILKNGIQMNHIFVGSNFKFGKARSGDYKYLNSYGKKNNFKLTPIKLIKTSANLAKKTNCKIYSSTNVRKLISVGKPKHAKNLLGRSFVVYSKVEKGDQRGRTIKVPTANLNIDNYVKPKKGVYAVEVEINRTNIKKKKYLGIANFGIRPTFNKKKAVLEVHIFNFNLNIYNSKVKVTFVDFLRDEKKFSGIEMLKRQVKSDILKAKKILSKL